MFATMSEEYININEIARIKGLTSNRSIRLEINKPYSKYIARKIKVNGGTSYEILFSSLDPDIQEKLREYSNQPTALVPLNYKPDTFISESAKLTALARVDIIKALLNLRCKYKTKKEADSTFLELYNSGLYLPKIYKFIGSISIGTLHRWLKLYEQHENSECLSPQYKYSKLSEYNSILNDLMIKTETRTINKHGITFFGMHYRSEVLLGIRDMVNIRYSLFDLTKIFVYSTKGEFLYI